MQQLSQGHNNTLHKAQSVVFFDGVCNLCNSAVNFLLDADRNRRLSFAPLQGSTYQQLLAKHRYLPRSRETFVFYHQGRFFTESTAALHVAMCLGGWWRLCAPLLLIPRWARDPLYRFVARRRYAWFGKRTSCRIPDPEIQERFLI